MGNGRSSKDCSLQSLDAKPFVQDAVDVACNALLSLIEKIKDSAMRLTECGVSDMVVGI